MRILFVCRGNVGRSQMAEAIFKSLNTGDDVLSAGTKVVDKEGESRQGQVLKDLSAAGYVLASLKEKGIDASHNVRTQLNPDMVAWADTIVVMAEPETVPTYLAESSRAVRWEVKDPKGTSLDEHRMILCQIETLVRTLV